MMMVFGSSGQVASELKRIVPDARFISRMEADLGQPQSCKELILREKPAVVINAAAFTAVDKAEVEVELATRINGEAPGDMAVACAELGVPLVHISSDYVFSGSGTAPQSVDAPVSPLNAYGRSKAIGEKLIRESGASYAILRSSWVFSPYGNNFVTTMLRLARTHDQLAIVADQVGGPTPASALAEACLRISGGLRADPKLSGTYHFSGAPDVSWADFARQIFAQAGNETKVEDIPTSAYPTSAVRPLNSRLDCGALVKFGIERPDWRMALKDVIQAVETI